jgi:hypothetical protein
LSLWSFNFSLGPVQLFVFVVFMTEQFPPLAARFVGSAIGQGQGRPGRENELQRLSLPGFCQPDTPKA